MGLTTGEIGAYSQVTKRKVKQLFGEAPIIDDVKDVNAYSRSAAIDSQLRQWHCHQLRGSANSGPTVKASQLLGMRGTVDMEYYRRFDKAARLLGDAPSRSRSKALRVLGDEVAVKDC
jgi:hypothetical protein